MANVIIGASSQYLIILGPSSSAGRAFGCYVLLHKATEWSKVQVLPRAF